MYDRMYDLMLLATLLLPLLAVMLLGRLAFQRALEKLAEVNGMVRQYAKWDIFQTHPPIAERIRRLG